MKKIYGPFCPRKCWIPLVVESLGAVDEVNAVVMSTQYLKKIILYPRLFSADGDKNVEDALHSNFKLSKLLSDFIQTSESHWLQSISFGEKLIQWYKNILGLIHDENAIFINCLLRKSLSELLNPQIFSVASLGDFDVFQRLFDSQRKFDDGIPILLNVWQESFGEAEVIQLLNLMLDGLQVRIKFTHFRHTNVYVNRNIKKPLNKLH